MGDADAVDPAGVFADWVEAQERGDAVAFDELLTAHPAFADELRRMYEDWRWFASILGRAVPGALDATADVSPVGERAESIDETAQAWVDNSGYRLPDAERYRFLRFLGRGGGGGVIKVFDGRLRRPVAMKVVRGGEAADQQVDPVLMSRLIVEARIAGQLDHPAIVPVHEVGADPDGRAYFTMRFVDGSPLSELFALAAGGDEEWTTVRLLGVLARVCEAVAYAHEKGVLHRDLKPSNVMVGRHGEVQVMDWGLAKARPSSSTDEATAGEPSSRSEPRGAHPESPSLTQAGRAMGTPAYMPPEQARGEHEAVVKQSDVYSIGAMLYELLAGVAPFLTPGERVDPFEIVRRVDLGPPRPLREVAPDAPAELVAICEKAMQREIDARYPNADALQRDLRAFLEGHVVSAFAGGAWTAMRKWMRRNKVVVGAACAVLAIGCAAVFVRAYYRQETENATAAEREARRIEKAQRSRLAFDAAVRSAGYGEWDAALAKCDEAEELGYDEVAVQLQRAHVLDARMQIDEAAELIESLYEREDLGDHRSLVTLLHFDPTRTSSKFPRRGYEERLLEVAEDERLDRSWRHYARACAAQTLAECRRHAEVAVDSDSRNRRAHELWLSLQLIRRGSAARDDALVFATMWQNDPYSRIALAVADALDGVVRPAVSGAVFGDEEAAAVDYFLGIRSMGSKALAVLRSELGPRAIGMTSAPPNVTSLFDVAGGSRPPANPVARIPPPFAKNLARDLLALAGLLQQGRFGVREQLGRLREAWDLPTINVFHGLAVAATGDATGRQMVEACWRDGSDLLSDGDDLRAVYALVTVHYHLSLMKQPQPQPAQLTLDMRSGVRELLRSRVHLATAELVIVAHACRLEGDEWLAAECVTRMMQMGVSSWEDSLLARWLAWEAGFEGLSRDIHGRLAAEPVPLHDVLFWSKVFDGQVVPGPMMR